MTKSLSIAHHLSSLIDWLILLTIFGLPLVFNPFTANVFELNKTVFLVVTTCSIIILWSLRNILTRSFHLTLTPFTLPLTLFTLISLIASYSGFNGTISAFINFTALTSFITIFFISATTTHSPHLTSDHIFTAIITTSVLLSITAILETMHWGPSSWITAAIPNLAPANVFISPTGSAVNLITFIIPSLSASLLLAIFAQDSIRKSFYFIASAIITAALVIAIFNILPGKDNSPKFLPFNVSWQIAIDNIKQPKSFLLGSGPQNYLSAFTSYKPRDFNNHPLWNARFSQASNHLLHIFTTTGLLGLIAWFFLIYRLFRLVRQPKHITNTIKIALVASGSILLIHLFVPSNLVTSSLFIFFLIAISLELKHLHHSSSTELIFKLFAIKRVASIDFNQHQDQHTHSQILPWIIAVPLSILCLLTFLGVYRVYAADLQFRQSLIAASQNQGTQTYNSQRNAINLNPYLSHYRRAYADTNLSIANALSQRSDLSDQDKQTITTLIRQSIREARNAVIIEPKNPTNWEILAKIYRNLINVADGAQDWTITSYANAIQLDPNNPLLRIELGGVYFQLKNYSTAIRMFEQAIALKSDLPNAHFNLAAALAQAGDVDRAIASYQQTLQLIDPSSADYSKALEELTKLQDSQGVKTSTTPPPQTSLETPKPLPSPIPGQEIELSNQDAPPTPQEIEAGNDTGFGRLNQENSATQSGETQ